jgi:hypothetical protein
MWWARQDSNLQPDRYERPALTIELQAPGAYRPAVPDRLQGGWPVCNGGSARRGRAKSDRSHLFGPVSRSSGWLPAVAALLHRAVAAEADYFRSSQTVSRSRPGPPA